MSNYTKIGAGDYNNNITSGETLPVDAKGQPAKPNTTANVKGPIPTSDWWTSLVYHKNNNFSDVMQAHPLAFQASAKGLSFGYNDDVVYINSAERQPVKAEYAFRDHVTVGLDGLNAVDAKLAGFSDWTTTAHFDSNSGSSLDATFGHGLPFAYFTKEGSANATVSFNAPPTSSVNIVNKPLIYEINNVSGTYNPSNLLQFSIPVNSIGSNGTEVADGIQLKISFDLNGDGNFDASFMYNFFPTDGSTTTWENYTDALKLVNQTGTMGNMNNGTIKAEIWQSIGSGNVELQTGNNSKIILPFENITVDNNIINSNNLYFQHGAKLGTASSLTVTPPATNEADIVGIITAPSLWSGPGTMWYNANGVVGITIGDVNYGIFGPTGSAWKQVGDVLQSDLSGKNYFSVAALPDNNPATLEYFRKHAYNFVNNSEVNYNYDQASGKVTTTFDITFDAKETGSDLASTVLMALYPHQYDNSDATLLNYSYISPRGTMKLMDGNHFETVLKVDGILPALPNINTQYADQLAGFVNDAYNTAKAAQDPINAQDTYWVGKILGKYGELAQIAHQIGNTEACDFFINTIKHELQDWFTASDGTKKQFYYNADWGIFQGYPGSYGSDSEVNDHHFHYGYLLKASAAVAQFDPEWAKDENWGGMVNMMIRDIAAPHSDNMFPYLRNFDPYAGHSWASGAEGFFAGNNQESSSEAMNFSTGLILWGEITGNKPLRDMGVYLRASEAESIKQYWFDLKHQNFPDGFPYKEAGIIWGDGTVEATWFSAAPEMMHGISYLPINGGSLYLGTDVQHVRDTYQEIVNQNNGPEKNWKDIIWQYQALADANLALTKFNADSKYDVEPGDSNAHTFHWLSNLSALGNFDNSISANTPLAAIFNKEGIKTYTAYNPGNINTNVTFSDGFNLSLKPGEFAAKNNNVNWSSISPFGDNKPIVIDTPPFVENHIGDQHINVDDKFNLTITNNIFVDNDGDKLTLSANLNDGSPLPSWLSFDPLTCQFNGIPNNVASYDIKVSASDGNNIVSDNFMLIVDQKTITPPTDKKVLNLHFDNIDIQITISGNSTTLADLLHQLGA